MFLKVICVDFTPVFGTQTPVPGNKQVPGRLPVGSFGFLRNGVSAVGVSNLIQELLLMSLRRFHVMFVYRCWTRFLGDSIMFPL